MKGTDMFDITKKMTLTLPSIQKQYQIYTWSIQLRCICCSFCTQTGGDPAL